MYPHFSVRSDFSFMVGASKVKDLVDMAKSLGIKSMALTDNNNLFGAYDFSKIAKAAGIMPIIGVSLPFKIAEGKFAEITLLAMSDVGYKNICHIMSDSQSIQPDGREKGYVDQALLRGDYNADIIVLSGSYNGVVAELIKSSDLTRAKNSISWFIKAFPGRFYLQINRNKGLRDVDDLEVEKQMIKLASDPSLMHTPEGASEAIEVPLLATSEVRYTDPSRHDAYELITAMNEGYKVDMEGDHIVRKDPRDYSMLSSEEMDKLFSDIPQALLNTTYLAQRCSFMVTSRDPILPKFTSGDEGSEDDELSRQAYEGLDERLKNRTLSLEEKEKYTKRLDYELEVINGMGFPGYFLIVSDFIKWAKSKGIPVGPGRGSGAGSMVAWSLMVTDLDPFEFGLLFERFLNPERVSMPDFDIDFCQDRRDEVISYVKNKYGSDCVSQIGTFGEVKSKLAFKNVGRILIHEKLGGFGFGETNEITKLIPNKEGSPEPCNLTEASLQSDEFRQRIEASEKLTILLDQAKKVEGLYDKVGSHAAGILIGDRPLDQLLPIRWDDKTNNAVSQFNMKAAESVGLVKFDFLGLKTLSVIKEAIGNIKEFRGKDIDIANIPSDDQDVFEMLAKGDSSGVFQFESSGMQGVLRQVKPTRLEDLIAVNALYRPGPMDQIEHYAECKNGKATPFYPSPVERTKPFLQETFGIMVYQEQVMMVAQEAAGYSLGGADVLRRAMGKKIPEEMDAQRKIFVEGAVKKGTAEQDANDLFDTIAKFAGYGFNKSHAAAYAWIGYQTAWLKRHYPAEFFAALLSYEDKPERMALIKDDMQRFNIEMLPPCVNRSYPRFRPELSDKSTKGMGIRFGLGAIKGISGAMEDFLSVRSTGEFIDIKDFSNRAGQYFDKTKIERMAESGGFDSMEHNRLKALSLVNWHTKNNKGNAKQISMFDEAVSDPIPEDINSISDWGNRTDREFNAVGFYFNKHPIDHFEKKLKHKGVKTYQEYLHDMETSGKAEMRDCLIAAMVEFSIAQYSQRGNYYLRLKMSEKSNSFDAMCFGNGSMTVTDGALITQLAKQNRVPVILSAGLVLKPNENKLSVFVDEVLSIDDFLGSVRGDIQIKVEMNDIQDLPEVMKRKIEIAKELESGKITKETSENQMKAERGKSIMSKLQLIKEFLSTLETNDPEDGGVGIKITLLHNGKAVEETTLDGKHVVSSASESRLKAYDGVIGVSESVEDFDLFDDAPEQEVDAKKNKLRPSLSLGTRPSMRV